jgi:two-component system sensor histidine kinase BaeS
MKIQNKLFLILFGFSLLLVTFMVLLMQWSIDKGMIDYVNTKEIEILQPVVLQLVEEYESEGNWSSMEGQHDKFRSLITKELRSKEFEFIPKKPPPRHQAPKPNRKTKQRPPRDNRPPFADRPPPRRDDEAYYALFDLTGNLVVGKSPKNLEYNKKAIIVDNKTVGFFAVSKRNELAEGYEVDFINQQHSYLWLIALIALAFVALVTFPLAQHVVKPIRLITQGMHKLTQGDYVQTIDLKRRDELGQLSRDYNELAHTLAENDAARKRWLANISHELRTPVAILRGELEAMLDEVRPLSKDNISSANDEVKHLQRLIDDLHQLTSADIGGMQYHKEQQNLTSLLHGELDKYRAYLSSSNIALITSLIDKTFNIYGDKTRLCQLFENIINNAIKYSKATEFYISLATEKTITGSNVVITFEDNGVGVDGKHLDHLFEYLYRTDESRNRQYGGAGLGLSICRQIVIAHHGEIYADKADAGGLAIIIKLPIS